MRLSVLALLVLAVGCGEIEREPTDDDGAGSEDGADGGEGGSDGADGGDDAADPCAECDPDAECDPEAEDRCVCPIGFAGDGADCVAVVPDLHQLRLETACLEDLAPDACASEAVDGWMGSAGGEADAVYRVTLRVRGVVEQKTFTGGMRMGGVQIGGVPEDVTAYNVYRLRVGEVDYFFNPGTSDIRRCWPVDFTFSLAVRAGDSLTLDSEDRDLVMIKNLDGGDPATPIVVPGIPPAPDSFNGQFLQIDVERVEPMPASQ